MWHYKSSSNQARQQRYACAHHMEGDMMKSVKQQPDVDTVLDPWAIHWTLSASPWKTWKPRCSRAMSHDPGSPKPSLTTNKSKRWMWKFVKDIEHRILMIIDRSSKLKGRLYTDHIVGICRYVVYLMHNQGANGQWLQETLSFTSAFASEKATRKTKHRSFLVLTKGWLNIFGIEQFFGTSNLIQYWVPFQKLQQKIGFADILCMKIAPTFAKQHQQRWLSEIRNP